MNVCVGGGGGGGGGGGLQAGLTETLGCKGLCTAAGHDKVRARHNMAWLARLCKLP